MVFPDTLARFRKALQQLDVIQQSVSKVSGCLAVLFSDVTNNIREIF